MADESAVRAEFLPAESLSILKPDESAVRAGLYPTPSRSNRNQPLLTS
jgi:hypothetical protein